MKKYCFSFILIVAVAATMAQPIKKAEKQMKYYNYSKAIEILLKVAEQEKYSADAIPLLAECYRLQHDPFNTKAWYGKAISLPSAKPEWYLYYATALMTTGDYKMSRKMFQKYTELNPQDNKGKKYAAMCDSVLGPWKKLSPKFEIRRVHSVNSQFGDFGPSIYDRKLVFSSDRMKPNVEGKKYGWTGRGFLDLYSSTPVAPGEFWGEMKSPQPMKGVFNQTYHDGPISFSKDGQTAYLTRSYKDKAAKVDNIKTNLLKIFYSEKSGNKWGKLKPFFLNSNDYSVGHAAVSPDGKTLYFVSDMPGGLGGTDIYKCERIGMEWGQPQNLGNLINTAGNEMFPYIFEDGTLFFASDGLPGYGGLDIFMSKATQGTFQKPVNLHSPINSSFDDFALVVAPGSNLETEWNGFFSSGRAGGQGNDDIYAFRKIEPSPADSNDMNELLAGRKKAEKSTIQGYVKDKQTLKPIGNATVFVLNPQNGLITILKTNPEGMYKMEIEQPANYILKAMKPDFISDCQKWTLEKLVPKAVLNAPRDLLLDKLVVDKPYRIENIYYDFDKYTIREDAKVELDKLVTIMIENPIIIELGSHTDSRGSSRYNERLSQNRAESAVRYIVSKGINPYRITAKGYGESQLTNHCSDGVRCTEADHQSNRRTEFKVTRYIDYRNVADQFNPDLFAAGDVISPALLPGGFFYECLVPKEQANKPLSTSQPSAKPQESAIPPVATNKTTPTVPSKQEKQQSAAPLPSDNLQVAATVKPSKSKNETAKPVVATPAPERPVESLKAVYTIQFATNYVAPAVLRDIPDAKEYKGTDGIRRYYAGTFKNKAEALAKIPFFESKGFEDAWIAPIDENRPVKL